MLKLEFGIMPNPEQLHARTIITIAPTSEISGDNSPQDSENATNQPVRHKRVAAYARVSTDQEEQEGSFYSQISFYTEYINSHPDWQFAGIYADKGLSGTSYKHRPEFNRMITDAKSGKIDLILVKSISRFARNTVDSLAITRDLKVNGIEVFFEKENLSSFDTQAELVFTIMASLAQEESRAISENVRWGKQRSMEAGNVSFAYKNFLGYKKGKDGNPEIVEKEAKIVRKIYQLYLDGENYRSIAAILTREGIPTPSRRAIWVPSTVKSILTNEKYKGDAKLGKTYVEDFLTHKVKVNRGERKQYYIKDSHDAVIPPVIFDKVQEEIKRRKSLSGSFGT